MATQKKYFHDHFILLLLSINAFLSISGIIFILVRLSASHGSSYIVQYRPSVGLGTFQSGSGLEVVSFAVFSVVVLLFNTGLSYKVYEINRQLAVVILSLGILLLILPVIITNALLLLR